MEIKHLVQHLVKVKNQTASVNSRSVKITWKSINKYINGGPLSALVLILLFFTVTLTWSNLMWPL